ncbi:MAG: hypothetical protein DWQ07_01905 [Chloroflexi bacterium]|nr:MAG: hypothetical protein DWQ07_01905 [Chloroflexota bacterium]MBL1193747.1 hypothetical protein [Chloroflexota bacterium]NOH11040.1 hypothetical protein [Chloroflexota bacterium]
MFQVRFFHLVIFIVIFGFLASCQSQPTSTPTTIPTATEQPTQTPPPTATKTPEPEPTSTLVPTIETPPILSDYLVQPMVELEYGLSYSSSFMWEYEFGKFSDGKIQLNNTPDWDAYFITNESFTEGHAILGRFSRGSGANYNIGIQTGEFGTPSFRGWSVHGGDVTNMSNRFGEEWLGYQPLIGNLTLNVNELYYILLAVNSDGEFLAVVWDANDPTRIIRYDQAFGDEWTGKEWRFRIGSKGGEVFIENLMLISFEGYK